MSKILAALAALVLMITLTTALTGCQIGLPCSNHGGIQWTNAKVYQCNDGTWE